MAGTNSWTILFLTKFKLIPETIIFTATKYHEDVKLNWTAVTCTNRPLHDQEIPQIPDGSHVSRVLLWPSGIGGTSDASMCTRLAPASLVDGQYAECVDNISGQNNFGVRLCGADLLGEVPLIRSEGGVVLYDEVLDWSVI